jgi:hypothetical protein
MRWDWVELAECVSLEDGIEILTFRILLLSELGSRSVRLYDRLVRWTDWLVADYSTVMD